LSGTPNRDPPPLAEQFNPWLDCFFGFVSLAVQRLPNYFIPTFPVPRFSVPRFLLPRYISVPSALNIAYIWASRNSLRLWNCAQHAYSQL